MATRSNIDFYTTYENWSNASKDKPKPALVARLYKHWDGYPDNMIDMFKDFRKRMVRKYTSDDAGNSGYQHKLNEGTELSAEFIKEYKPKFGDLHPAMVLNLDINYLYELYTSYGNGKGNWELRIYEIDNWDKQEKKTLIKKVILD